MQRSPCSSWFSHQVVLYFCALNTFAPALFAGLVQHLTPDRGEASQCWGIFGSLTCFIITYAHCAWKLLQLIDLIITHPLNESLLDCAEAPAVCGEVASNVYVYVCVCIYTVYILIRQWLVSPLRSVLCCAVLLCFSSAVIIKTLLISFGHLFVSPL